MSIFLVITVWQIFVRDARYIDTHVLFGEVIFLGFYVLWSFVVFWTGNNGARSNKLLIFTVWKKNNFPTYTCTTRVTDDIYNNIIIILYSSGSRIFSRRYKTSSLQYAKFIDNIRRRDGDRSWSDIGDGYFFFLIHFRLYKLLSVVFVHQRNRFSHKSRVNSPTLL